jgi:hypothetical protein
VVRCQLVIFAVRLMLEKRWAFNKYTCLPFIDLEKMHDNINRQEIWKALHMANVSKLPMKRMKNIYEKCNRCESFQMCREVRQGSVLSATLFSVVMDELIRRVTEG